jgi:tRNA(fMet)-specific endonuclease VapC
MKVLDTTFLIDFMRGSEKTLKIAKSKEILLTTQINMYEVIRGLFLQNISSSKIMEVLEFFENIRVLPLDDAAIIKSAEISAELIKKGKIISDCDCMTAGISQSKGINTIVTNNIKHFQRIKGIKTEKY